MHRYFLLTDPAGQPVLLQGATLPAPWRQPGALVVDLQDANRVKFLTEQEIRTAVSRGELPPP